MANNNTGLFTSSTPFVFSSSFAASSSVPTFFSGVSTIFTSEAPSTVEASSSPSSFSFAATTTPSESVVVITSNVVSSAPASSQDSSAAGPQTILITSTEIAPNSQSQVVTHTVSQSAASSKTTSSPALATAGAGSSSSGLSTPGRIAIAVVVPVVAVALLLLAGIFFWRKRKQRKDAEELRRKEVEEYGFNPNNDPTLPAVGGASSNGDDPSQMTEVDGAGYRGWGTTSNPRKPSTTLSSGNGPIGIARSTSGSDNGRFGNGSPTGGTNKSSDVQSNDPLVGSPSNGRPLTGDSETIGALGAVPTNNNQQQQQQQNMHRGPSNASSAYSGAHHSDTSGEGIPGGTAGQPYYNDGMYYDEGMPQHGPYGDGSYGGGQPVIRDVPARRNTRIENPSIIPQQGSAGIAQNF